MRIPNDDFQERVVIPFDHPQVRLVRATYINPTGLAEHADNHFALSVKNGSTVMAGPYSTDADGVAVDDSLAADTFVDLTLSSTASELVAVAGDVISCLADEGGTATLPPGRFVIEGYLS
jgi:hypothetical protein